MTTKDKLNFFQLALLLIHAQIGVGMITLVNDVYFKAGIDSWLSIIVAGILIQCMIFVFGLLMKRFPDDHLFTILEKLFGKVIGKTMSFLLCLYFIFIGAVSITKYTVILKSWLLPITPKWIIIIGLILVTIYAAKDSLHVITRFYILAFFVIFLFLGFVMYSLKDANVTYILPIGKDGLLPIIEGSIQAIYAFQGFEYLLFLAPFTLGNYRQITLTASVTNWFITIFYTFVVLANQLFFSGEELKLITEPVFYLIKSFSFRIIERPDLLFTSLWIVLVITSTIVLYYIVSLGFASIINSKNRYPFLYVSTGISFIISMLLYGEERINYVIDRFYLVILSISLGLPTLLLIVSWITKKTGKIEDEEKV